MWLGINLTLFVIGIIVIGYAFYVDESESSEAQVYGIIGAFILIVTGISGLALFLMNTYYWSN